MPRVSDKASQRGHVGTRTNRGSRIDYITEKPYLHHQLGVAQSINLGLLAAISWHWLRLACLGWPAGFESTCVWSSTIKPIVVCAVLQNVGKTKGILTRFKVTHVIHWQNVVMLVLVRHFRLILQRANYGPQPNVHMHHILAWWHIKTKTSMATLSLD